MIRNLVVRNKCPPLEVKLCYDLPNIKLLQDFAGTSSDGVGIVEGLWSGVGVALSNTINELVNSLNIIPDEGELAKAATAIESLNSIFSGLTGLMGSVQTASAYVVNNALAGPAAGGVPATSTPNGRGNSAGSNIPTPTGGSGGNTEINLNISWQTYTGEPSESEIRRLVGHITPELDRLIRNRTRTSI